MAAFDRSRGRANALRRQIDAGQRQRRRQRRSSHRDQQPGDHLGAAPIDQPGPGECRQDERHRPAQPHAPVIMAPAAHASHRDRFDQRHQRLQRHLKHRHTQEQGPESARHHDRLGSCERHRRQGDDDQPVAAAPIRVHGDRRCQRQPQYEGNRRDQSDLGRRQAARVEHDRKVRERRAVDEELCPIERTDAPSELPYCRFQPNLSPAASATAHPAFESLISGPSSTHLSGRPQP